MWSIYHCHFAIITVFLLTGLFEVPQSWGQSSHQSLRRGDSFYKNQEYAKAEEAYRRALEKNKSPWGNYNLGNAIYQQERFEEAARRYESALESYHEDPHLKAKAYHNLGNAYFQHGAFDKSIDAYKNALRINPNDLSTKHNLALAQVRQQQQEEQRQKDQPQEQHNQQEQEQQDNQRQQDGDKDEEQTPQHQDNESRGAQDEENATREKPMSNDLSREEAKKLLEIMDEEEQKVQKKLRKTGATPTRSGKDW
jgi:tetratricopeptide (TPR) repeat protein